MSLRSLRRDVSRLEARFADTTVVPVNLSPHKPVTAADAAGYWAACFETFGLISVGRRLFAAEHPDRDVFLLAGVTAVQDELDGGYASHWSTVGSVCKDWNAARPIAPLDPGQPSSVHDALVAGLVELAEHVILVADGAAVGPADAS